MCILKMNIYADIVKKNCWSFFFSLTFVKTWSFFKNWPMWLVEGRMLFILHIAVSADYSVIHHTAFYLVTTAELIVNG